MDGFKNSTKTQYMKGGSVGERKIGRVMEEFTKGKLHSGSKEGPKVKSTKQAVAIALNEARAAGAKIPRVKKARGGMMEEGGTYNERGKRATLAEIAAEGRRVENEMAARAAARRPVEGISTRPTDSSGRRMTDKELGMTPGGVSPAKKKGVPAHSNKPMIRRNMGGLTTMPKGKC